MELGRLEKMELRRAWPHEASDFTKWLAKEENLSLLSDEVGVDIKLLQTEANVGSFNVDILAEEENTGKKIIIENQLELTDHDHLGKIITYASGHDAKFIIWVVKDVREEHRQAIDWLNDSTDEDINFFVIKMELWKIQDSLPAPKFQIISKPNEWAKAVKKSSLELTETKMMQLDFWNSFLDYVKDKGTSLRMRKANPQHWYDLAVGSSDAHISLTVNTQEGGIGCELYIPDNKGLFEKLKDRKDYIEKELGTQLSWMVLGGKKASRIKLISKIDMTSKETWENCFPWLKTWAEKFYDVFGKKWIPISKGDINAEEEILDDIGRESEE
jgi:hypothetical protein